MAKKKKTYDDDDGRVVADMSGVTKPSLFGFQPAYMDEDSGKHEAAAEKTDAAERPWEDNSMQPAERFAVVGGAMKGALLIGGVYVCVFGAFIWLLTALL